MSDTEYTSTTTNVGHIRCESTFASSDFQAVTDLPEALGGLAKNPSPGALLGATLASCMISMISYVASRKNLDMTGLVIKAKPVEVNGRFEKIELKIIVPLPGNHPLRGMIEKTALACPVHGALREDLETPLTWVWLPENQI